MKSFLKRSDISAVLSCSKGHTKKLIFLSFFQILAAFFSVYLSLASKNIIDAAGKGSEHKLLICAVVLAVVIFIQIALNTAISWFQDYTKASIVRSMRQKTLDAVFLSTYPCIKKYHSGELINRMFSDINIIADGAVNIIPPFLSMTVKLIGAAIILYALDKRFALVILCIGLLIFAGNRILKKKLKTLHKLTQQEQGKVHSLFQESVENIKLIKASSTENTVLLKARHAQESFFSIQAKRRRFMVLSHGGIQLVFNFGWAFAMIWGCFGIVNNTLSYGTLAAMLQLVNQIQAPFASMSGIVQKLYSATASVERVREIFDMEKEAVVQNSVHGEFRAIDASSLCFFYDSDNPVLNSVSFKIQKGDFAAITGLSGAGKSTLFMLLLGIYKPTSGSLKIDLSNNSISPDKSTRSLFAYVPQGNSLFSGTLRENITMFNKNASESEICSVLKCACIYEFISSLPDDLDTLIGERGLGLSEGQAQRIAIARALLSSAPVLLFDEATSALDEKTEAQLLENISLLKNRTLIIVTHRKAALSICNKQIEVKKEHQQ